MRFDSAFDPLLRRGALAVDARRGLVEEARPLVLAAKAFNRRRLEGRAGHNVGGEMAPDPGQSRGLALHGSLEP